MEKFEGVEKQLDRKEIDTFQEQLGVDLPQDFIDFYLVNNGGFPPYNYVKGEDYFFAIDGFVPIKYGALTIEGLLANYGKQGFTLEDKVPFANDPGGGLYFLSTAAADKNSVYIIPGGNEPDDEDAHIYVCKSFSDFLEGMTNDYEGDEE